MAIIPVASNLNTPKNNDLGAGWGRIVLEQGPENFILRGRGSMKSFFPAPWFAWGWLALLLTLVFLAAYVDLRRYLIPKWLTITVLVGGVVANTVRGAWLGSQGIAVWTLSAGVWFGAFDGLLFALAGFLTGFGLFFALWLLRTCGGGDVKLFAGIGAWIGPEWCLWVLGLSIMLVAVLATIKLLFSMVTQGPREVFPELSASQRRTNKELTVQQMLQQGQKPKRLLSFSLPVALSLTLFLAWKFRHELQLPILDNLTPSSQRNPGPHL